MGAQHRVAQPPVQDECQHVGGAGVHPERRDTFDPQQAVISQPLDGLVASRRRAAQDPVDRVVLQADDQPLGLAAPQRRQGPKRVGAVPAALVAGVGVPH